MNITTLGPQGTFSHQAVVEFDPKAKIHFCENIEQAFELLKGGACDRILVPLENSTSGFIQPTLNCLLKYPFFIQEQHKLPVSHFLAGFGKVEEAEVLYVHPHTYRQCYHTIQHLCPNVEVIYTPSNGASAIKLKEGKSRKFLAIIPKLAAEIYNLPLINEKIEDNSNNVTRFVLIGKKPKKGTWVLAFLFSEIPKEALTELLKSRFSGIRVREVPLADMECPAYLIEYKGKAGLLDDFQIKPLGQFS